MDFRVIICALILNLATGWLFKPYTGWLVNFFVGNAKYFSSKKYKTVVIYGRIVAITGFIAIWILIDYGIMYLEYQSQIYSYIINGILIYFCVGSGQLAGVIRKFAKNTDNDTYIRQLLGYMLVPGSADMERVRFKKTFTNATAKILAERIVMPGILILVFGMGAAAAYTFINIFANSDNHVNIISHGYASCAITLNKIFSWPGYAVLSLLLWAVKWIFNMKFSCKNVKKYSERCFVQLNNISNEKDLSEIHIKSMNSVIYMVTVLLLVLLLAVYIFTQTALAAVGLDEYWNFWNGSNLQKQ